MSFVLVVAIEMIILMIIVQIFCVTDWNETEISLSQSCTNLLLRVA